MLIICDLHGSIEELCQVWEAGVGTFGVEAKSLHEPPNLCCLGKKRRKKRDTFLFTNLFIAHETYKTQNYTSLPRLFTGKNIYIYIFS